MSEPNHRFLRALLGLPVDTTPIWIMRQAGRYLPEYREIRAQAGSFMALCTNPELACEVTMQPLRRYDLDAAILFSDILTIPDAMGLGLYFETGEGPKFERVVRDRRGIEALPVPDPSQELRYVIDAVSTIRRELNDSVPLIGFSGSPWTLASYMVEGGATKDFRHLKALAYGDAPSAHRLLDKLADAITVYLNAQIQAGAQAVQIFDTWGGVLGPATYEEFSLNYMAKIVDGLDRVGTDGQAVPVIVFTKGAGAWLNKVAAIGADAVGVDWGIDMADAVARVDGAASVQGNLDPGMLFASDERLKDQIAQICEAGRAARGHVFNLGHGITQGVDPDRVKSVVDWVHELGVR